MSPSLDNLLINPITKSQLKTFLNQPSGALLISGVAGSGKKSLTKFSAAILLNTPITKVLDHPHLFIISKPHDKSEILIEQIRDLVNKTSLRVAADSSQLINRVAIIQNAQLMNIEAQNSLLKLLEEPPAKTLLILTADSEDNLLPTIVSRMQRIGVIAPTLSQSLEFFNNYPSNQVESAWRLSQGGAGLMQALLENGVNHPLKLAVEQAKKFIASDTYTRLIQLQQISKDRVAFTIFLDALARVLAALHVDSINKGNQKNAAKILRTRAAVESAISSIGNSSNSRLVSLALAISTPL